MVSGQRHRECGIRKNQKCSAASRREHIGDCFRVLRIQHTVTVPGCALSRTTVTVTLSRLRGNRMRHRSTRERIRCCRLRRLTASAPCIASLHKSAAQQRNRCVVQALPAAPYLFLCAQNKKAASPSFLSGVSGDSSLRHKCFHEPSPPTPAPPLFPIFSMDPGSRILNPNFPFSFFH